MQTPNLKQIIYDEEGDFVDIPYVQSFDGIDAEIAIFSMPTPFVVNMVLAHLGYTVKERVTILRLKNMRSVYNTNALAKKKYEQLNQDIYE